MTDKFREKAALRFRELLDSGVLRKKALLQVKQEMKAIDEEMPCSRTRIYEWCKRFGVSTR
jgi:hypothetical protein